MAHANPGRVGYTSDQIPGEIDDIEDAEVELISIHVVEMKPDEAIVNVNCKLQYQVRPMSDQVYVVADDPDIFFADHETDATYYPFRISGSVSREEEGRIVTVTLAFNKYKQEGIMITKVEFEDGCVEIDIVDGGLTRIDDIDDYDDSEIDRDPRDEQPEE